VPASNERLLNPRSRDQPATPTNRHRIPKGLDRGLYDVVLRFSRHRIAVTLTRRNIMLNALKKYWPVLAGGTLVAGVLAMLYIFSLGPDRKSSFEDARAAHAHA